MTVEELFSVQTDNNKLRSLQLELARHEDFNPYKSQVISDMPKGSGYKNFIETYEEKRDELQRQIDFLEKKIQEDRKKIDEYIDQAPYPECDIIRFRAINNLSWQEIGDYVGYSRRQTSKKFWNYINNDRNDRDDRTEV